MNRTNEKAAGVLDTLATAKEKTQGDSTASACTNCRDNRPLPVALDIFDEWAVDGYIKRRIACDAVTDGEKPCLRDAAVVELYLQKQGGAV